LKITTRVVFDMETMKVLEEEWFEYEGPLALAGGGPSSEQKAAASSQRQATDAELAIAKERAERERRQYQFAIPFIRQRLDQGNPYTSVLLDNQGGVISRAFQPAYARVARSGEGPSGSYNAQVRALDAEKARAQADAMGGILANDEASRVNALAALTNQQQIAAPQAFFGLANSGNNSIMQAPLQSPGFAAVLGGVAGAALSNPSNKIPF
jgi:hypothetical protein